MRLVLPLLLLLGCARPPAVSPEQVRQRFTDGIQKQHLEALVHLEGDELVHTAPGQKELRYPLKAGYAVCAKDTTNCDLYVNRVLGVFKDSVDHDDH